MRSTAEEKSRYYKYAAIFLTAVFLISACLFAIKLWENGRGDFPEESTAQKVVEYGGKTYELKKNVEAFLVLGLDKAPGSVSPDANKTDIQADFIMLFVFDNDERTCSALHINRDTIAEMNILGINGNPVDTVKKQIALSYNYGNGEKISCRNTLDSVSTLLHGMRIDHYFSVTMDAVPIYNDLLGGVEVEILDDFSGIDDALVKGERVTLTGRQALTYVRTRQGLPDETNLSRMVRQRQYLSALRKKTVETLSADDGFAVEATTEMAGHTVTDRSVTQMQELLRKFSEYDFIEAREIEGETKIVDGLVEFHPDEDSLLQTVIETFYKEKQ